MNHQNGRVHVFGLLFTSGAAAGGRFDLAISVGSVPSVLTSAIDGHLALPQSRSSRVRPGCLNSAR